MYLRERWHRSKPCPINLFKSLNLFKAIVSGCVCLILYDWPTYFMSDDITYHTCNTPLTYASLYILYDITCIYYILAYIILRILLYWSKIRWIQKSRKFHRNRVISYVPIHNIILIIENVCLYVVVIRYCILDQVVGRYLQLFSWLKREFIFKILYFLYVLEGKMYY